jgi:two-component system response regulator
VRIETNQTPILIADDDAGDRLLMQKALEDNGVKNELRFAKDGKELLEMLGGQPDNPGVMASVQPCLILLDLNMPRLDGRECLKLLKLHPELKKIPIVVLTNSRNPVDINGSYQDGANSFFTKPLDYVGLVALADLLKNYWLRTAQLPSENS